MAEFTELPEPDRLEGAAHPREAAALIGHAAAEAEFLRAAASGRLHSGWLISGPQGVGKATLAYRIAGYLLAGDTGGGLFGAPAALGLPEDHPDGRLIRADTHSRLAVVRRGPTEKGDRIETVITVRVVRRLKDFFQLSAADGGHRVVIIDAADELNPSAANALLKELEEPPPRCTLLLIAHQPSRLLPTIRSRCRNLRLGPLEPEALAQVLAAQGQSPEAPEALALLAGGSVRRAMLLAASDGLQLYAQIIRLFEALPRMDRPAALKLADSLGARGAEEKFALALGLIDLFLARAARTGLAGEPQVQGAPGEARLLARLAPHDRAARIWAEAQVALGARARAGRAVNLDPSSLILDMLLRIEEAADTAAA